MVNDTARDARNALAAPLITAFVASGAIMLIELSAGRLISRHLGMSLYTWTSIIAIMMAGMSTGNAVGGWVADRFAPRRALGVLFLLATIACAGLLPLNDFLGGLAALRGLDWPLRIFLHCAALFFLPAVALGGIAPVVARLALGLGGPAGRTVGLVYASSVAGSIFCTFLTGYSLVMVLGVRAIFLLAAATLGLLALLYLAASIVQRDTAPAPPARPGDATASTAPWWPAILTVILSNFAFMAIELAAARLLSRDYGSSVFTWTATIGVFLAGITLGNALGGWVADTGAGRRVVAKYFLAAAAASFCGPLIYRLVHNGLTQNAALAGLGWGSRTALVLGAGFFLPCLFLGYISPLIVKRGLDAGRAPGRTVASVYAWGAVGGVLGTLATGYWLIDALGSLPVIAAAACLLAIAGAAYHRGPLGIVAVASAAVLGFLAFTPSAAAGRLGMALQLRPMEYGNVIYQDESQYSYIAIKVERDNDQHRTMILDKLDHSKLDLTRPEEGQQEYEWIYKEVLDKRFPPPAPIRTFFMGGGGFTVPSRIVASRPGSHVEVAEIDPAVTRAAEVGFKLDPTGMEIHNMDARNRITTLIESGDTAPYDLIVGDTFNNFSVPSHLTTLEYTRLVKQLLKPDGIYLLNMIDMQVPGMFLSAFVHTLREVFPNIYLISTGRPPTIRQLFVIVCSAEPLDLTDIPEKVRASHPFGGHLFENAALEAILAAYPDTRLTDDFAPTDLLLLPVVTRGDLGTGQEHFGYALEAAQQGNADKAITEARIAIEGHPGWPEAYELIADMWLRKQQPKQAHEALLNALRFTPEPSRVLGKIGNVYLQQGDTASAGKAFDEALAANPRAVDALFGKAAILMNANKFDEVIPLMQQVLSIDPKRAAAHYNIGLAHSLKGDPQAARAAWEAGLQAAPDNPDLQQALKALPQ